MKQVLFRIPGLDVPVYGFGLMVVVAFYVALALAAWRGRRERLDPGLFYDLSVWMLLGGLVGARLFYVVEYWGERVTTLGQAFRVWEGGIVFYGGVVGGFAGFFLYRAFRPFPVRATLDAVAPSIALGAGLGRIGCFLNGCCYGDVCGVPWLAVRFPSGSPPWQAARSRGLIPVDAVRSLPLHPTQLYAALDGLILCALLSAYFPLRRRDGEVIALLMVTYPVSRYLIEQLRDDESALVGGMTVSQFISVVTLTAGLALWSYLSTLPARRWSDAPGSAVSAATTEGAAR